jgi:putative FmdB family regulatory protein
LPIYTYQCAGCDGEVERRQSFSDAPLTICESCGGSLRRVLHPVGVIFKGSGFYNTDYKKSSSNGTGSSSDGAGVKASEGTKSTDSSGGASSSGSDSKSSDSSASSASAAPAAATS